MNRENQVGTILLDALAADVSGENIAAAARILAEGGLVAFPTETVYGLGANALDAHAVEKIYTAKGRPGDNPLIVHVADTAQMMMLAKNIPPEAYCLAELFWPGPLTLVLEKKDIVPLSVTGGLDSVAIRVPDHPVALALLKEAALPVAAPSANLSGRPSPTTARHVLDDLNGRIDAVLDGGSCGVGVESTVLDIRDGRPRVLRPGGVTPAEIAAALKAECPVISWSGATDEAPSSPGMKYTHYAPQAPLYLFCGSPAAVARALREQSLDYRNRGKRVGLLLSAELAGSIPGDVVEILGSRSNPAQLAANLYGALRRLDTVDLDVILAEGYPEEGMGLALMNRMQKAAGPRIIKVE
ncbi:MAG: L-threonylcarbamoyladenylate synthase [Bacillota bacterium]|nr:L-threonylcarbamoyladenylate synthase [Bacillota bacterium]